ncbi:hypothetical protein LGQ02_04190 [Bacillus shivajii]|uniref:hypothetical protein n=1 Tax=Bacillus shivajii TaxID=1983719 RepID=UPI001CF974CF|nr:hypothetical protein [Bacillus shivajii]UCZ53991.1 hypothetical protein LGQ02_04190 [Bacillus shivajii]
MKNDLFIGLLFLLFIGFAIITTEQDDEYIAYIHADKHSNYAETFHDLNLGDIFNFHFVQYEADSHWVNLWVDEYIDGEKQEEPHAAFGYGKNLNETISGNLGFGKLNRASDESYVFMYAPGVTAHPTKTEPTKEIEYSSWRSNYAISSDRVGLKVGETKRLAVYQYAGDQIYTYDYQNEKDFQRLIGDSVRILVFNIKITDNMEK